MLGTTSISGLASGLQTDQIIEKLIEIERRPSQQYESQQQKIRSQLSAYREANTRLTAIKDAADALALPSAFSARTAESSDTDRLLVTAEAGASVGDYEITILSLARRHQVRSQAYADLDTTRLGTGTLTLTSGGKTTEVTVDSTNNTLAGVRDTINRSGGNVRASIVRDGDSSYRLLLSSKESGTVNEMTITSTLSGGTDPTLTELQGAADAQVRLGSGSGAVTSTTSTNQVRDLIPGVTLDLRAEDAAETLHVSVAADTTKTVDGLKKLVEQFNAAADWMKGQFKFDAEKNVSGTLLGDFALRNVQNDLYSLFTGSVEGLSGTSMADIGLTVDADGKLAFDSAMLEEKLDEDPDAVTRLLALTSESSDVGIQLLSVGRETAIDGSALAVNITQAARQARVTGGTAMAADLDADEVLTVNGTEIQLTAGMTLADVLATVNAQSDTTGVKASATGSDGTGSGLYLTFSAAYGSKGSVSIASNRSYSAGDTTGVGNVAATHTAPAGESGSGVGQTGLDVAGTINGETATGAGQVLSGTEDNATTAGLKLRITSTNTGAVGTIKLFSGIAHAAERALTTALDSEKGPIGIQQKSLDQRIDDLQKILDERQESLKQREESLRLKFAALESAMSQFQGQSAYLGSQLAALK